MSNEKKNKNAEARSDENENKVITIPDEGEPGSWYHNEDAHQVLVAMDDDGRKGPKDGDTK